jgi:serine/threonine-protein kinase
MAAPMMAADPLSLIGQTLDKIYRVDALVGEGGFGVVYKGFHLGFEQPIAIKCLKIHSDFPGHMREAFLQKFREEGRLLFQLSQGSIGIVRAIAIGDTVTPRGDWTPFVVLEWLEGCSLADDLERRRNQGCAGRPLAEVVAWLDAPARALGYAHRQRVAHRDIKPGNLFILREPQGGAAPMIKLLDFGIAKVMAEGANASAANPTVMGFSSFTPDYAASEQFDPQFGSTGPWTDVYSLALLAAEMLSDRPACAPGEPLELLRTATDTARRPTPRARGVHLSDAVEAVFRRALAVSPPDRYPDLDAFWEALVSAASLETRAAASALTGDSLPVLPPAPTPPAFSAMPGVQPLPATMPSQQVPQTVAMAPGSHAVPPPRAPFPSANHFSAQPVGPWAHAPAGHQPAPQWTQTSGGGTWIPLVILGVLVLAVMLFGLLCTCSLILADTAGDRPACAPEASCQGPLSDSQSAPILVATACAHARLRAHE